AVESRPAPAGRARPPPPPPPGGRPPPPRRRSLRTDGRTRGSSVAGEGSRLPRAVKYIIGNEACERFSFYGMSTILVPYMQQFLGWGHNTAESIYHYFVAAAYAMTVVGGWISDRFLGRYRTILWLSYGYVLGHAVLAAGDLGFRVPALFIGLTLIVIGQSGIKPNLSAFVGDQFRQEQRNL